MKECQFEVKYFCQEYSATRVLIEILKVFEFEKNQMTELKQVNGQVVFRLKIKAGNNSLAWPEIIKIISKISINKAQPESIRLIL